MAVIREADLIDSVAEALQYISCFHPPDFIRAMAREYIGRGLGRCRMPRP